MSCIQCEHYEEMPFSPCNCQIDPYECPYQNEMYQKEVDYSLEYEEKGEKQEAARTGGNSISNN